MSPPATFTEFPHHRILYFSIGSIPNGVIKQSQLDHVYETKLGMISKLVSCTNEFPVQPKPEDQTRQLLPKTELRLRKKHTSEQTGSSQ